MVVNGEGARCGWGQISVRFLSKDDWRLISQTDLVVGFPRKGQTVWHFLSLPLLFLLFSLPVVFCGSLVSSSGMAKVWLCDTLVIRNHVCVCGYLLKPHSRPSPVHRLTVSQVDMKQKVIIYKHFWHSSSFRCNYKKKKEKKGLFKEVVIFYQLCGAHVKTLQAITVMKSYMNM